MNRTSSILALCALSACGQSHDGDAMVADAGADGPTDATVPVDALEPVDARPESDGGRDEGRDAETPAVYCAGVACAPGEECCFLTGSCFDPDDAAGCEAPSDPDVCHSNRDCPAGFHCRAEGEACLGAGSCSEIGEGCGSIEVCGCDGRTYRNHCAATRAGVRVSITGWTTACGERVEGERIPCDGGCPEGWECDPDLGLCFQGPPIVACGVDANCPDGQRCCTMTGTCFDAVACPDCCTDLPDNVLAPCREDADCLGFGYGAFCFALDCEGPGGCAYPPSSCGGELAPVCGCDGAAYTNACWARQESTRLSHEGTCE